MPWPWKIARTCFDLRTGQVIQYPIAGSFLENEWLLDYLNIAWRVWQLFHKDMSIQVGDKTVTNYTPSDIDLWDYLNSSAWE